MSAFYEIILRYYTSLDPELPRPQRHSSHMMCLREGKQLSATGAAVAAALWTTIEPSPSTGLTCPIPLAFVAAHPITRLATEKSAAGYRACGVLVWHRPLSKSTTDTSDLYSGCSAHPLLRPLPESGARADRCSRDNALSPPCSSRDCSDSSRSSSASSLSLRTDPGAVGPPPGLRARSGAVFTPQVTPARVVHGRESRFIKRAEEPMAFDGMCGHSSRGQTCAPAGRWQEGELASVNYTTCPLQRPIALPTESKIIVLLHTYETAAKDLEEIKRVATEHVKCSTATTGHASVIWQALQPLQWWLEGCVRPGQSTLCCARSKREDLRKEDKASNAEGEARGLSHGEGASAAAWPPRLSCVLRLFVSPAAMLRSRRRRDAVTKPHTPLPLPSSAARTQWCRHALIEIGLCGLSSDSPLLFSPLNFLNSLGHRRTGRSAFASFRNPFTARGQSLCGLRQQQHHRGLVELLDLEDVLPVYTLTDLVSPASAGTRNDTQDVDVQCDGSELLSREQRSSASALVTRLLASLPVPLLPLHTLDLSLRTDLCSLEDTLSRWAAAGLLRCLRRLSLMGCRQLRHLRWLSDLPSNSLEVLNISGCDALRHLRSVRRLSSLRQLKATQLLQLRRLGWWDDTAPSAETPLGGLTAGDGTARHWPAYLEELDLSCTQPNAGPIADFACIGLLDRLRRLSVSVPREEQLERQNATRTRAPQLLYSIGATESAGMEKSKAVTEALLNYPFALEWLTGCSQLRELRLSFACGGGGGSVGVEETGVALERRRGRGASVTPTDVFEVVTITPHLIASFAVPTPVLAHLVMHGADDGSTTLRRVPLSPTSQDVDGAYRSPLSFLSLHPFPALRTLELHHAVLVDGFTSWIADGCPQLRALRLLNGAVRCSAEGIRRARRGTRGRASSPSNHHLEPWLGSAGFSAPGAARGGQAWAPNRRPDSDWDTAQRKQEEQWWWGQLTRLRHLRSLHVISVDGLLDGSSLDWIAGCASLQHLTFRKCHWLLDVYAAHRLPRLRTLNLSTTGIDDLTFLRMRNGVVVDSALAMDATHVSYLQPQRIRSSHGNRVVTLPPLTTPPATATGAALSRLTAVVLIDCPFARDLSPLSSLTSCLYLFASDHHHVTSLEHLAACAALEELYLIHYAKLSDISALRWLTQLRVVHITHSSVRDLSWVACPVVKGTNPRYRRPQRQQRGRVPSRNLVATADAREVSGKYTFSRVSASDTAIARHHRAGELGVDDTLARQAQHLARTVVTDETESETDTNDESDAGDVFVLPRLEVLTLTDSRLLTDVRALGALPRLQQLYLNDCVSLNTLGSAVEAGERQAPWAPPLSSKNRQRCGDTKVLPGDSSWWWEAPSSPLQTAVRAAVATLAEASCAWRQRARTAFSARVEQWRTSAVVGWLGRALPPAPPLRSPSEASCEARLTSPPSASAQQLRTPLAPYSLARLHFTLRYLNVSGCHALVDGSAIGSLERLEYLHASFTGIRDVRWVRRCGMLKVLDLVNSPCCVGAAKAALEAELPQCLPELALLNSRPVDELQPRSP